MNHINTLVLHQLRLGELESAEEARVRAHLSECALCASRATHQRAVRTEFQRTPMPAALEPRPTWWEQARAWLPAAALVPVALAAVFVVKIGTPSPQPQADAVPTVAESPVQTPMYTPAKAPAPSVAGGSAAPSVAELPPVAAPTPAVSPPAAVAPTAVAEPSADIIRTKGLTPRLEAWVQAGGSSRPLYLGETVGAGTKLQLRYDAQGRRFVTLAGRDSNGVVEVYGTVPGGEAGLTSAPLALTLDDSKGEQAFFAICTDDRPSPDAVMSAVKHNPVRMNGAAVSSVVVRKD